MNGGSESNPAAIACAVPGIIIVIKFTNEITDAFADGSVAAIIMSQTFETGGAAFTDLSACAKMDYFPVRNSNTTSCFNHVQNNIFWCCYWGLDLSNRGIGSNDLP